jgi:hypothetical protein
VRACEREKEQVLIRRYTVSRTDKETRGPLERKPSYSLHTALIELEQSLDRTLIES